MVRRTREELDEALSDIAEILAELGYVPEPEEEEEEDVEEPD